MNGNAPCELQGYKIGSLLAKGRKRRTKSGCRLVCSLGQFFLFLFCVQDVCGVLFPCFWL